MRAFISLSGAVILVSVVVLNIDGTSAHRRCRHVSSSSSSEECPKQNIFTVNLNDPIQNDNYVLNFTTRNWNNTNPKLTKRGQALKTAVMRMANSDIPRWRKTALVLTPWIWHALPQIQYRPSLCGMAKLINATSTCGNDLNCDQVKDAMSTLANTVIDAAKINRLNALQNSGCLSKNRTPEITVPKCFEDGVVHSGHQLWKTRGWMYPCIFQTAAKHLINSKHYIDNYMGAVATAAITEGLHFFHDNFNLTFMYTMFQMQNLGPIRKECCKSLFADLRESLAFSEISANTSKTNSSIALGCP